MWNIVIAVGWDYTNIRVVHIYKECAPVLDAVFGL